MEFPVENGTFDELTAAVRRILNDAGMQFAVEAIYAPGDHRVRFILMPS